MPRLEEIEQTIGTLPNGFVGRRHIIAAAFSLTILQDRSYALIIILLCKITLWNLFNYLLPGHFFNDSLTIL